MAATVDIGSEAVDLKQIICIKWGTRYGPEYVNRMYGMLSRSLTGPFQLYCLTDENTGIRSEVKVLPLPELGCPVPSKAPGKWRKTALWGHELYGITGVALFLDLDVVITGNMDDFFTYGNPDDVVVARNWIKPLERLGQTSVFRYPIGKHGYMLDNFRKDPEGLANHYQFEQRFVTKCVKPGIVFFPTHWVAHFRLNCLGPWPLRYLRPAVMPKRAKVVIFPGKPDPHDAKLGRWSESYQPMSRREHLRLIFSENRPKGIKTHLKRYVMPVSWIAEYWRE